MSYTNDLNEEFQPVFTNKMAGELAKQMEASEKSRIEVAKKIGCEVRECTDQKYCGCEMRRKTEEAIANYKQKNDK